MTAACTRAGSAGSYSSPREARRVSEGKTRGLPDSQGDCAMSATLDAVKVECLPTTQDVDFYQENGYWTSPQIFTAAELAEIREHQDRVYSGTHETGRQPWRGGWKPKAN